MDFTSWGLYADSTVFRVYVIGSLYFIGFESESVHGGFECKCLCLYCTNAGLSGIHLTHAELFVFLLVEALRLFIKVEFPLHFLSHFRNPWLSVHIHIP